MNQPRLDVPQRHATQHDLDTCQPHSNRRVVHLPFYEDNPYQMMIMEAQARLGWETIEGGGGGNFLGTALKKWRADVYHFHWLHPYLLREGVCSSYARSSRFLLEVLALKASGARIIHTLHNLTNHDNHLPSVEQRFTSPFLRICDAIIVHGNFAADSAVAIYGESIAPRLRVISHPNYRSLYPNALKGSSFLKRNTNCSIRFGFFGRIERYKCVDKMIRAFTESADSQDSLCIRGRCSDESLHSELTLLASHDERVSYCEGYVSNEDVPALFETFDLCLCPSDEILTSGSVWLALTFHKPIIAPRDGCIPEHVGKAGWLYGTSQLKCIGEAIAHVCEHRSELAFKSQHAAIRSQCGTVDEIAMRICGLYTNAEI